MYRILKSDDVVYCDVDDTLVLWNTADIQDKKIYVNDPYIKDALITLVPHERNITLLKRMKGQKKKVIVWSLGGVFWAETIVKALQLQDYVDLIVVKPRVYIDDNEISDWGCSRVYMSKHITDPEKKDKKL